MFSDSKLLYTPTSTLVKRFLFINDTVSWHSAPRQLVFEFKNVFSQYAVIMFLLNHKVSYVQPRWRELWYRTYNLVSVNYGLVRTSSLAWTQPSLRRDSTNSTIDGNMSTANFSVANCRGAKCHDKWNCNYSIWYIEWIRDIEQVLKTSREGETSRKTSKMTENSGRTRVARIENKVEQ